MAIDRKVQVVTGGTSGMGLSLAAGLAKFGPVIIGGRSEDKLAKSLDALKALGIEAYGVTCDISDLASVKRFREDALGIGEIGYVVNAAGVDFDNSTIEQILSINMGGVVNVTEAFWPDMENNVLVHFSSNTGYHYNVESQDREAWDDTLNPDFLANAKAAIESGNHPRPSFLDERYTYY